ncbi:MAG: tyrosine-type recombinase/integrase [Lachnospiraceae bacterium]|nr:tyrosine-type recombinase/integrase [Lachnospiraceae bacterium]
MIISSGINNDVNPLEQAVGYKRLGCGLFVPGEVADEHRRLDPYMAGRYAAVLKKEGKAPATVQKYMHDIRSFVHYLGDRALSISVIREWLEVQKRSRHVNTVNNAISALNGFFRWLNRTDCRCAFFRTQKPQYRDDSRDLSRNDFDRLTDAADSRMRAVLLTLKGTGIRVSELKFFTVEAVMNGMVTVDNKGKVRTVFIDPATKTVILNYCEGHGIRKGIIFRNGMGLALSRTFIWRSLKALARRAGVELSKVFPHNLRHLFAVERYSVDHDIEALRLDLGHTLISTTQRYLMETVTAHFEKVMKAAAAG